MPMIYPKLITHDLNIDLSLKLVKQKRMTFTFENNEAINEEKDKL